MRVRVAVDLKAQGGGGSVGGRVQGGAKGVFVGIQQDAFRIVVARTSIGLQGQDVGADDVPDRKGAGSHGPCSVGARKEKEV